MAPEILPKRKCDWSTPFTNPRSGAYTLVRNRGWSWALLGPVLLNLDQSSANYAQGPNVAHCLLLEVKLDWHTAKLSPVYILSVAAFTLQS